MSSFRVLPQRACFDDAVAMPSAAEQAAIDSFVPVATLPRGAAPCADTAPAARLCHLLRRGDGKAMQLAGQIGSSADGRWLICFGAPRVTMLPIEQVLGFELLRLRPSRRPATTFLMLACQGTQARPLLLTIARSPAPEAMTALAQQLSQALGRPLVVNRCQDNC